jgi:hypothetical protein
MNSECYRGRLYFSLVSFWGKFDFPNAVDSLVKFCLNPNIFPTTAPSVNNRRKKGGKLNLPRRRYIAAYILSKNAFDVLWTKRYWVERGPHHFIHTQKFWVPRLSFWGRWSQFGASDLLWQACTKILGPKFWACVSTHISILLYCNTHNNWIDRHTLWKLHVAMNHIQNLWTSVSYIDLSYTKTNPLTINRN